MYSDITARLDTIDKKLDSKADKSDIVRIENKQDDIATLFKVTETTSNC